MNRQENRAKNLKKDLARTARESDKKVSFHGPQNGGHFSCGKPVPHLRTSPVKQQNCGSNKFLYRGGREDETDARAEHQTHWRGASNEGMIGVRVSDAVPGIKPIGKTHRKVESKIVHVSTYAED